MQKIFLFFFIIGTLSFSNDEFEGYWMKHNNSAIIKIRKNKQKKYDGYIVWIKNLYSSQDYKNKGIEQYDVNNPNKNLRKFSRKIRGLKIIEDLYKDEDKLKGGKIYNPKTGKSYYLSIRKRKDKDIIIFRISIDKFGIFGFNRTLEKVRFLEKYNIIKI